MIVDDHYYYYNAGFTRVLNLERGCEIIMGLKYLGVVNTGFQM